ncbi:RES family NAD+ phosphorylase [Acerihabitans arboris]|uniref:RES domain-containing protein n=1 Tax=Acerihabitans arboris TaxID=2691583 RepID=A0A845SGL5_9GAMM|nr:RES family NAD+ phosphorylase [Acerihabitans arboris]NDL62532.1 RES domain-containing protein [Acerihabitans arboris]
MQSITAKFPPLPLNELIPRINGFETNSLNEKQSLITDLINAHTIFSVDILKGSVFRRARKINEKDYPELVQDLLWKPDGLAVSGRANPEGFSVLYVADKPETAFRETHIDAHFVLL